jgi:hypothetical protein
MSIRRGDMKVEIQVTITKNVPTTCTTRHCDKNPHERPLNGHPNGHTAPKSHRKVALQPANGPKVLDPHILNGSESSLRCFMGLNTH